MLEFLELSSNNISSFFQNSQSIFLSITLGLKQPYLLFFVNVVQNFCILNCRGKFKQLLQ